MSTIEPTEEQYEAAILHVVGLHQPIVEAELLRQSIPLAALLAEREHKLREGLRKAEDARDRAKVWLPLAQQSEMRMGLLLEACARIAELEAPVVATSAHEQEALHYLDRLHLAARGWDAARELAKVFADRDANAAPRLAKRVAELEAANGLDESAHLARIAELYRDNAAHLATIKALRISLGKAALRTIADGGPCWCVIPIPTGSAHHMQCAHIHRVYADTAHYDVEGMKQASP
jgi:hypothetical protein